SDEVKRRQKLGTPGTYNSKDLRYRAPTDRGVPEHNFHGLMCDSLTGATKPDRHTRVQTWDDAAQPFPTKNAHCSLPPLLAAAGDLRALLPKPTSVAVKNVDYYDLLDFGIRQSQRILRDTGRLSTTLVPYTNRKWISALVATGDSSARERAYYRLAAKEFATYFPELSEYSITSRDEHVKFRENLMKSVLPTLGRLRNDDGSPYTPQVTSDAGRVLPGRQFCEFAVYHNNPSFRWFFDELYEALRARTLFTPRFLQDVRQLFL